MWRDPAGRGVSGYRHRGRPLAEGQLAAAVESLALGSGAVAIATGFWIPTPQGGAAETDGPPGALYLARALAALGRDVLLLTDAFGLPLLEAGCDALGLPRDCILEFPFESPQADHPHRVSNAPECNAVSDRFVDTLLASPLGQRIEHLIAIERAGPSHTLQSWQLCGCTAAEDEDADAVGGAASVGGEATPPACFETDVPEDCRDVCHNMRGESINAHTAKIHRLFEMAAARTSITTIGIADGGNEIGMGRYPWHVLCKAIAFGPGPRVACRIPTDFGLLAGVSNWGGYALALAVCHRLGRLDLAAPWNLDDQRTLVETIVAEGGGVDGVTRLREATVDGLPLETYLQPLFGIRQTLGLAD